MHEPIAHWFMVDSVNNAGGILVKWDESKLKVQLIKYSGQWTTLFGMHIQKSFNCALIGVYAGSLVNEMGETSYFRS